MKFPDLVHAAKPEPHFAMPQAASAHDTFWDFASLMPESVGRSRQDLRRRLRFHRRDLWEAIEAGAYPEDELGLQIFTEDQAEEFTFDVLDATKIVPEDLVPIVPVGRLPRIIRGDL